MRPERDLAQCIGVAVVDLAQVDIRTIMVVHGLSAAFCIEDAVHIGAVLDRKVLCSISLCCRVCFHFALPKYASHAANMLNSVLPVSISRGTLLYWVVAKPSLGSTTPSPYR